MTKTAEVADYMERKIGSGEWDISQPIPSLNDLADECGAGSITVSWLTKINIRSNRPGHLRAPK